MHLLGFILIIGRAALSLMLLRPSQWIKPSRPVIWYSHHSSASPASVALTWWCRTKKIQLTARRQTGTGKTSASKVNQFNRVHLGLAIYLIHLFGSCERISGEQVNATAACLPSPPGLCFISFVVVGVVVSWCWCSELRQTPLHPRCIVVAIILRSCPCKITGEAELRWAIRLEWSDAKLSRSLQPDSFSVIAE